MKAVEQEEIKNLAYFFMEVLEVDVCPDCGEILMEIDGQLIEITECLSEFQIQFITEWVEENVME